MKFKILAIRNKDIVWSGGTFKKYEVKTDQTGADIIESQLGLKKNEKLKVGDIVEGYLGDNTFNSKNGPVTVKVLKAITAEYVYKLLLKLDPDIESKQSTLPVKEEKESDWVGNGEDSSNEIEFN